MRPLKHAAESSRPVGGALTASGPCRHLRHRREGRVRTERKMRERLQVWGAFVYVDGPGADDGGHEVSARSAATCTSSSGRASWFHDRGSGEGLTQRVGGPEIRRGHWTGRRLWQVGLHRRVRSLQPDARPVGPSVILEAKPQGGETSGHACPAASETPADPATYQTNAGVVKFDAKAVTRRS